MRFILPMLASIVSLATAAAPVLARDITSGPITISQPWSRATPGGAKVAAGYLTIRNSGDAPDQLTAVTSDIAETATPHTMVMTGDTMQMRPIVGGLVIPPHGAVTLKPGAEHLMFEGLRRPLKQGEHFTVTLSFEKAGAIPVELEVGAIGAKAPSPGP